MNRVNEYDVTFWMRTETQNDRKNNDKRMADEEIGLNFAVTYFIFLRET